MTNVKTPANTGSNIPPVINSPTNMQHNVQEERDLPKYLNVDFMAGTDFEDAIREPHLADFTQYNWDQYDPLSKKNFEAFQETGVKIMIKRWKIVRENRRNRLPMLKYSNFGQRPYPKSRKSRTTQSRTCAGVTPASSIEH